MQRARTWIDTHPDLWEFIKFNVLSNIATITNFLVLWICSNVLFTSFSNQAFQWTIFDYSVENGGLNGFLSFLMAYIAAQIVNYIVQRKLVFGATVDIKETLHWYILTIVVAGILSIVLPPYVINLVTGWGVSLNMAQTLANVVNIVVQVVINYPMMKFVIMKK